MLVPFYLTMKRLPDHGILGVLLGSEGENANRNAECSGWLKGDPRIIAYAMESTMRKDMKRIVPKLVAWLLKFEAGLSARTRRGFKKP